MISRARSVLQKIRFAFLLIGATAGLRGQVAVAPSYFENFNSIGIGLPSGWAVWTDSMITGNGNAFNWTTSNVANNAAASSTSYFRNVPGASQSWTSGLAANTDRAIGWRAGSGPSRDGSITFTLANTANWTFTSLSFDLFTPNSSGTVGNFQFQYQIGSTGTFTNFSPAVTYTNTVAQNPLIVTSISLSSSQLALISGKSSQVTLRLDNSAATGTTFNTVALDNFSYTATSTSAVPEPGTFAALMGTTVLGAAYWKRKRRRITPPGVWR